MRHPLLTYISSYCLHYSSITYYILHLNSKKLTTRSCVFLYLRFQLIRLHLCLLKLLLYCVHSTLYTSRLKQGPLKKWTEHSLNLHLLKILSIQGDSNCIPGLDGGGFYEPGPFICLVLLQVPKCFALVQIFCARPKIYLHIVAVTNILCQTKR